MIDLKEVNEKKLKVVISDLDGTLQTSNIKYQSIPKQFSGTHQKYLIIIARTSSS
jgi:phosphatidate phosphatase PAH1